MSLNGDLAPVVVQDARYTVEAYVFVLHALEHTRSQRNEHKFKRGRRQPQVRRAQQTVAGRMRHQHVTGQELCRGARDLARKQYGLLAWPLLQSWGIQSTSDLGEIVYNLIASGDLEKTPNDTRSDFNDVFDLADALSAQDCFTPEETDDQLP